MKHFLLILAVIAASIGIQLAKFLLLVSPIALLVVALISLVVAVYLFYRISKEDQS